VADIFQEVDEEVRRERARQFWERHGNLVIAVAVLIVLGVGGWRGYEWWQLKQSAEAGAAFEGAAALVEQGKHEEAEQAFAKVAKEGPAGYRVLARFREATEAARRDPKAGIAGYDSLAADASIGRLMQDLAAVRAALLLVDTATYDDMRVRLEPLTADDRPFRHAAREALAFSAWRAGDRTAAKRWLDLIMADAATPAATRSRVEVLMALTAVDAKG
jgi:hypothetical protein